MLDILRKRASSLITKLLLGLICVVFIFFFGSSSLRSPGQDNPVVAFVDGEPIVKRAVDGRIRLQKDSNPLFANLPESFNAQIEQSVISGLVNEKIATTQAHQWGLRVTDKELSDAIVSNENLLTDGQFDHDAYTNNFLPAYLNRYGVHYEKLVHDGLLQNKLTELFQQATFVSEAQTKKQYLIDNTKISLNSIVLRDSEKHKAKEVADKLWPLFQKDKLGQKTLDEYSLKETKTPLTSMAKAKSLIGGQFNVEVLSQLFKLSPQKPYPTSPLTVGNDIYFFKLLKYEKPTDADFEKAKKDYQQELRGQIANQFYTQWFNEKKLSSNIEFAQ